MKKKNPNKPHRPRSPLGVHVARRNATSAPFKHRLEPKQGAKNDQPELLEEVIIEDTHSIGSPCHCGRDEAGHIYASPVCQRFVGEEVVSEEDDVEEEHEFDL